MKIKLVLKPILAVIVVLLAASNAALADESSDYISELLVSDAFHPPAEGDPGNLYNEWHYFNMIDEEQNLSAICTFKLNGDTNSSAVLLGYYVNDTSFSFYEEHPLTPEFVNYSSQSPDIRIANNTVTLTDEGYRVHIESGNGVDVFDALFKPKAEPAPVFNSSNFSVPGMGINWLVASPKMEVSGNLSAAGQIYSLNNARAYHDHNWGYWSWGEDLGWDWGQVSQAGNYSNETTGGYSLSFGNITNANHSQSISSVLNVWEGGNIIGNFSGEEIQIEHSNLSSIDIEITPAEMSPEYILPQGSFSFPQNTLLNASSGSDTLKIEFTTQRSVPLTVMIPDGSESGNESGAVIKYRIIWEMIGTYQIYGVIDGKPISYTSDGFMEYVAGEPVSPVLFS
ncbi:hypothetical protein [Methanosarcina sp.]|jgi:hypothetical protein|uniref:hypothetical protein n=1 Tax=Methanosarcina sp. TaxID=2213 RepID=UPI002C5BB30E|nr:hypothetical protein [Methanosarcina sp.]HOW14049.1 hypothetical protein [Methanosarcina sp.]